MTILQMQLSRPEAGHCVLPILAMKFHLKGQSEALLSSSLFYYVLFTFSCGSFYEKCTPSSN